MRLSIITRSRARRFREGQRLGSIGRGFFDLGRVGTPLPTASGFKSQISNLKSAVDAAASNPAEPDATAFQHPRHHCPVCLCIIPVTSTVCDTCPTPEPL